MAVLDVQEVHAYYGEIHVLKGVSLTIDEREIVTLIGANGAGKTSLLRTMSGLLPPRRGSVRLRGEDLTRRPPHEIVAKGLAQVPEGRRVFERMTVQENLEMGAFARRDAHQIQASLDRVYGLFPRLAERRKQLAGTLSGGEQQMLAMGRALMSGPRILLLDEPSMGLAPVLVETIFETIKRLHAGGATILLVEQNARMALLVSSRGYVMQTGRIVLSDSAENLRRNETVRQAYLGEV